MTRRRERVALAAAVVSGANGHNNLKHPIAECKQKAETNGIIEKVSSPIDKKSGGR